MCLFTDFMMSVNFHFRYIVKKKIRLSCVVILVLFEMRTIVFKRFLGAVCEAFGRIRSLL